MFPLAFYGRGENVPRTHRSVKAVVFSPGLRTTGSKFLCNASLE